MALGDRRYMSQTQTQAGAAQIDEGLRKYMLGVYNYMALGVAFTGIVALFVASQPALLEAIALSNFRWVLFIGILGLVMDRLLLFAETKLTGWQERR